MPKKNMQTHLELRRKSKVLHIMPKLPDERKRKKEGEQMNDILTSELEILTWLVNHFVVLIVLGVVFWMVVLLILKAVDIIPRGHYKNEVSK